MSSIGKVINVDYPWERIQTNLCFLVNRIELTQYKHTRLYDAKLIV